jgi:hypothetical protein
MHTTSVETLWETAPTATATFDPRGIAHLPPAAQRYFTHALAPGAPLSTAARIEMTGTLRLDGAWCPFVATQVLRWDRGFIWKARATVKGLPVFGSDRLLDGEGAMRWKLLGLFPVVTAEGADIGRSAAGRLHAEAFWMPGVLLGPDVRWSSEDSSHATATLTAHGEPTSVELGLTADGSVRTIRLARWGDLGGGPFHYETFGGEADEDRTFGGVTLPTRYRVGWHYGTDRFESEGEFFRCRFESVTYR